MSHKEALQASDVLNVAVSKASAMQESARASGVYSATLLDKDGNVKWEDTFKNVVTTVGGNFALDTLLAGNLQRLRLRVVRLPTVGL